MGAGKRDMQQRFSMDWFRCGATTLIYIAASLLTTAPAAATVDCSPALTTDDGTFSFDLTPLQSRLTYVFRAKIGSYHYRYHGTQYDYLVNVCDNVHVDRLHPACLNQDSAPAYQVTAPPGKVFTETTASYSGKYTPPSPPPYDPSCFRLADPISDNMMNWTLLNSSNPEDGIRLTYTGGQTCRKRNTPEVIKETNETWRDVGRIFEIEFECDRELGSDSRSFLTDLVNSGASIEVQERSPPDECHYIVRWRTQYGCPSRGVTFGSVASMAFRWTFIGIVCVLVFVVITKIPTLKMRFQQWKNGNFNGGADFVSHVASDLFGKGPRSRPSMSPFGTPAKENNHML